MTKEQSIPHTTKPTKTQPQTSSLPMVSMVLGVTSLAGPGLLLGIPAIIIGAIALKKQQGERGLSLAGLITGIISTVLSIIVGIFFVLLMIVGMSYPEDTPEAPHDTLRQMHNQRFDRSST